MLYFQQLPFMDPIVTAADVTTLVGTYGDVFAVIASATLLLGGLFIVKGGYRWTLGMIEKAINFGGK